MLLNTADGNINVLDGYGADQCRQRHQLSRLSPPASPPAPAPRASSRSPTRARRIALKASRWSRSTIARTDRSTPTAITPPRRLGGFGRVAAGPVHRPERRRPHGELSAGRRAVRLGGWAGSLGDASTDLYETYFLGLARSIWVERPRQLDHHVCGKPSPCLDGEWIETQRLTERGDVTPGTGSTPRLHVLISSRSKIGTPTTKRPSSRQTSTWYGTTTYYETDRHHHAREEHQYQQHSGRPADQHQLHRLRRRRLLSKWSR